MAVGPNINYRGRVPMRIHNMWALVSAIGILVAQALIVFALPKFGINDGGVFKFSAWSLMFSGSIVMMVGGHAQNGERWSTIFIGFLFFAVGMYTILEVTQPLSVHTDVLCMSLLILSLFILLCWESCQDPTKEKILAMSTFPSP